MHNRNILAALFGLIATQDTKGGQIDQIRQGMADRLLAPNIKLSPFFGGRGAPYSKGKRGSSGTAVSAIVNTINS